MFYKFLKEFIEICSERFEKVHERWTSKMKFYLKWDKIRHNMFFSEQFWKTSLKLIIVSGMSLTHFEAMFHFYSPWERQKIKGFQEI